MSPPLNPAKRVGAYLIWLLIVTVTSEGLVASAATAGWHSAGLLWIFELSVAWSPAIAALFASVQTRRSIMAIGWRLPSWRMLALAYAIPLAYSLATYGLVWLSGLGGFPNTQRLDEMTSALGLNHLPSSAAFALLVLHHGTLLWLRGCVSSLGEEIGWRGFLLPELAKVTSYRRAAIFSGLVWSAWHLPLILFGGYHGHNWLPYSLACFTLVITTMSFPLAWLRLRSGEVWTCTAFHASHNLFILKLFNPLTIDTGPTRWLVSEFGILTVLMTALTAWCFRSPPSRQTPDIRDDASAC